MRGLSDAELIAAVAGWLRAESAACARKMAAIAEVFRRRTGLDNAVDRENWFVDPEASAISEMAAAQNITETLAMFQTHRAVMLNDRLPKVAALMAAGLIDDLLVRAIVARTALITDPTLMAAVDADLAAQIATWGPKSEKKTKAAIDAIVEVHDPGALRRVKNSEQDRDTQFGFYGDAPGFMTMWARMYAPDGAAFEQRVNDMARSVCAYDPRSVDERRHDALAAVATGTQLRCECDHPDCPATGGEGPTKDVVIHVIATQDTLDETQHANAGEAAEPAGEPNDGVREDEPTPVADESAADDPAPTPDPAPAAKPSPTPAPAFVLGSGVLSRTVLPAFLHRAKLRQLRHPGNAAPEPHYRPSAALADFVRCRDLTCRFPGCDVPATRCDIDHTVPWPPGPTCASNLKSLCRKHHLLKTFWTGKNGWHDQQFADGTVEWTSPSGQTYTTQPGSMLLFPTLCVPTAPALTRTPTPGGPHRGLMMPKRRRTRAQDRARRIQAERKLNDDLVAERNKPPPF